MWYLLQRLVENIFYIQFLQHAKILSSFSPQAFGHTVNHCLKCVSPLTHSHLFPSLPSFCKLASYQYQLKNYLLRLPRLKSGIFLPLVSSTYSVFFVAFVLICPFFIRLCIPKGRDCVCISSLHPSAWHVAAQGCLSDGRKLSAVAS